MILKPGELHQARGCGNGDLKQWPKMKPCVARDGQTAASDGNCNGCGKEAANLLADYVQRQERLADEMYILAAQASAAVSEVWSAADKEQKLKR